MRSLLVEHAWQVHIKDMVHAIPTNTIAATITIGSQELEIVGRITNLKNGYRYFFLCPSCGYSHEYLYQKDFSLLACRVCHGLKYSSSMIR